ncbi:MAG: peroxiredoxin [Chitinophagaceae bacterium]|nr:peroxiredoxin [Chitinophagaceae bacterium]
MTSLESLPADLPVPLDDGACDHLQHKSIPDVCLIATSGRLIALRELIGKVVIYCYPMTGKPGVPLPQKWDEISGARGCTPQVCSFRDHHKELLDLGVQVFGLSTQSPEYQKEAKERLHLPFDLLSDNKLEFANSLNLPCFSVDGMTLTKRITLIFNNSRIVEYFYPVFPPDKNIYQVLDFLKMKASAEETDDEISSAEYFWKLIGSTQ